MTSELADKLSKFALSENESKLSESKLDELHSKRTTTNKTVLAKQFNDIINRELLKKSPQKVLDILVCVSDYKVFINLISADESLPYLRLLKPHLKQNSEYLHSALDILDVLVHNFDYKFEEIEHFLPYICTLIGDHTEKVQYMIVKFFMKNKAPILEELENQFENLIELGPVLSAIKMLTLLMKLDQQRGRALFMKDECHDLLKRINVNSNKDLILASLELLNIAAGFKDLRDYIFDTYLPYLELGLKSDFMDIKLLSCLILSKLWLRSRSLKEFNMEEILPIILSHIEDEYAMESITHLSLRIPVKKLLRQDHELIFDLTKILEDPEKNRMLIYGAITTLANLSKLPERIDENDEIAKLRQQAMEGLEAENDDSRETILKFNADLIERLVIRHLSKLKMSSQNLQESITELVSNLLDCDNATREKCISQNVLPILISFLTNPSVPQKIKFPAYKSLVLVTHSLDPSRISSLLQILTQVILRFLAIQDDDRITTRDYFFALLTLVNFAGFNGDFSEEYWLVIDMYLVSQIEMLRKCAFEIVANLSGYDQNFPRLFNNENLASKKRLDLVVDATLSDNIGIQSAAITTLVNGTAAPFIAVSLVSSYGGILERLVPLLVKQCDDTDIIHRLLVLFDNIIRTNIDLREAFEVNEEFPEGLKRVKEVHSGDEDIMEIVEKIEEDLYN